MLKRIDGTLVDTEGFSTELKPTNPCSLNKPAAVPGTAWGLSSLGYTAEDRTRLPVSVLNDDRKEDVLTGRADADEAEEDFIFNTISAASAINCALRRSAASVS